MLAQLEGMPGDIDAQARELQSAAEVMERTSNRLQRLADGTDTISKAESMDAVREAAGDVAPGLSKAATRYRLTGGTLVTYAAALESAQLTIGPMVEDIHVKHQAVADARDVARAAQGVVNDHGTQWVWEAEVTEAQKATAESGLTSARASLGVAEGDLEDAWEGFDRAFGVWEDAYDAAVDGIDAAFDAADNDDAWGEDALTVLGYVAVVLSVVALFCTGPLALVIMALGAAVAAVTLAINIAKMAKGRGSWVDIGLSVVGLIPFVRPLGAAIKGARAGTLLAKGPLSAGQKLLPKFVRSTLPPTVRGGRMVSLAPAARAKAKALLGEFDGVNNIFARVKMNAWGGGHSDLAAYGNFIRSKGADVVGAKSLEWVNRITPAASEGMQWVFKGELISTVTAGGDFLANEHVQPYREWRARMAEVLP